MLSPTVLRAPWSRFLPAASCSRMRAKAHPASGVRQGGCLPTSETGPGATVAERQGREGSVLHSKPSAHPVPTLQINAEHCVHFLVLVSVLPTASLGFPSLTPPWARLPRALQAIEHPQGSCWIHWEGQVGQEAQRPSGSVSGCGALAGARGEPRAQK